MVCTVTVTAILAVVVLEWATPAPTRALAAKLAIMILLIRGSPKCQFQGSRRPLARAAPSVPKGCGFSESRFQLPC